MTTMLRVYAMVALLITGAMVSVSAVEEVTRVEAGARTADTASSRDADTKRPARAKTFKKGEAKSFMEAEMRKRVRTQPMVPTANKIDKNGQDAGKYEIADCGEYLTCCSYSGEGSTCDLFKQICAQNGAKPTGNGKEATCAW